MYRTCLKVVGNLIKYPGGVSTGTSYLTMEKLLFRSNISTQEESFMCHGINNFYVGTPIEHYAYIHLPINIIPEEIITQYNLRATEKKLYVYDDIRKLMYGLPQARRIENDFLTQNLAPHGY